MSSFSDNPYIPPLPVNTPIQEPFKCAKCGREFGWTQGDDVTVGGISGFCQKWCWPCAGYNYEKGRFETREDWIRESVPMWASDYPVEVLADWCQDNGRYFDGEYLRKYGGS